MEPAGAATCPQLTQAKDPPACCLRAPAHRTGEHRPPPSRGAAEMKKRAGQTQHKGGLRSECRRAWPLSLLLLLRVKGLSAWGRAAWGRSG